MGVKAHLGATKFRMHGDHESISMLMINDHPALYVAPEWKDILVKDIKSAGIVF